MKTTLTALIFAFCLVASVHASSQSTHSVYFSSASSQVPAEERNDLIQWLATSGYGITTPLRITGYADIRNTPEFNQALSSERANAVNSLLANAGFVKLSVIAKGEIGNCDENDDACLGQSRRVEIEVDPVADNMDMSLLFDQKPYQRFTINAEKDNFITGSEGTEIHFKARCFKMQYLSVQEDSVEIFLREYVSTKDMILAGITTAASEGLLETGGSIEIAAYRQNNMKQLALTSEIGILFSGRSASDRMSTFRGSWKEMNGTNCMVWAENKRDYQQLFTDPKFYADQGYQQEVLTACRQYIDENPVTMKVPGPSGFDPVNELGQGFTNACFKVGDNDQCGLIKKHVLYAYSKTPASPEKFYTPSSSLGFINCDRWINSNIALTTVPLRNNDPATYYILYFSNIKSILPAYELDGGLVFPNVPEGSDARLIAIRFADDQYYFGEIKVKCSPESISVQLAPSSKDQIQQAIQAL